jgi:hypothetical protein
MDQSHNTPITFTDVLIVLLSGYWTGQFINLLVSTIN